MRLKLAFGLLVVAAVNVGLLATPASATRQAGLVVRPNAESSQDYPPLIGVFYDDHTTVDNHSAVCESAGPCDLIPLTLEGVRPPPGGDVIVHLVISFDDAGGTERLNAQILDPAHEGAGDHAVWDGPMPLGGRIDGRFADPPLSHYDLLVNNSSGVNRGFRVDVTVEPVFPDDEGAGNAGLTAHNNPDRRDAGGVAGTGGGADTTPSTPPALSQAVSDIHPVSDRLARAGRPSSRLPIAAVLVALISLVAVGRFQRRIFRERGVAVLSRFAPRTWFSNLRLFWKLLVPFVAVIFVIGTVGTFLTVRYLSSRASATLDQNLLQRSASADAYLRDEELYLLEAERFAANLEGVPAATAAKNQPDLEKALASAVAVRKDLDVLSATDTAGTGLVDFASAGASFTAHAGADWSRTPAVRQVLAGIVDQTGDKHTGFVRLGTGAVVFLNAGPIRTDHIVGAALAGISAGKLAQGAADRARARVALYDGAGELMASSGGRATARLDARFAGASSIRDRHGSTARLYSPFVIRGVRVGTVVTAIPTGSAFAAVRGAAFRLGLLVILAMAATVALGVALSRYILRALDPLVAANRALAAGDLSVRVPVLSGDELAEVAAGVNQMAEALQTSYENLEARVADRTAEVTRLLQERTDFFTAVSHEFRTPLAVILGQAKMLRGGNIGMRDSHTQTAAVLSDAGNQLLGFVNDILDIARAESGHTQLDLEEVHVGALVRAVQPTLRALSERNGVKLIVRMPPRLATVRADEARLRQVVVNLVDNAIKYTPPGGVVRVLAREQPEFVTVSVADTGIGIPAEAAERLFEPFYRVKGNETQAGQPSSGLGLALVKALVDAMGGTIAFESAVGKGTTFTVGIPIAASVVTHEDRNSDVDVVVEGSAARIGV